MPAILTSSDGPQRPRGRGVEHLLGRIPGTKPCLVAALTLLLVASRCSDLAAQQSAPRDVSPLLKNICRTRGMPGMVGLTIVGPDVTAAGVYGVRKRGSPELVTIDDRFHLGSCTKSMTATLLAMLVNERKLRRDSTLAEVFPSRKAAMHADWHAVTLEQLLTNRSGAVGDLLKDSLWSRLWTFEGPPREHRLLLLDGVTSRPPEAPPGSKYIYSNAGFAMAGAMAEEVTGKAWEDLMRERLFKPLGMKSAGFGAPGKPGSVDEPWGHKADGTPVEPGKAADNPAAIGPAGTVHATIGDWAKYIALHLEGAQGRAKLLGASSFKKLHAPVGEERYAMGWSVALRDWADGDTLSHAGSNTLWYAVVWIAPRRNFAVLICSNKGGDTAAKTCDEAAWALIQDHLRAKQLP